MKMVYSKMGKEFISIILSLSMTAFLYAENPPISVPSTPPLAEQPNNSHPQQNPTPVHSENSAAGSGPNTVDLPESVIGISGNWVKKKNWLLRSAEINNTIQELSLEIQAIRLDFINKRATIDGNLDQFYKKFYTNNSKLDELFTSIEKYLTEKFNAAIASFEKNYANARSYQIKMSSETEIIRQQKTKLAQLKLDMKSIEDLDKSLAERLKKVDASILTGNTLSQEAQEKMNLLWDILDDKKARVIYYELSGTLLVKIKNIQEYLKTILLPDFIKVVELVEKQITTVQTATEELEKEGIIIQQRTERLRALKIQNATKNSNKITENNSSTASAKKTSIKKAPLTIIDTIKNTTYKLLFIGVVLVKKCTIIFKELFHKAIAYTAEQTSFLSKLSNSWLKTTPKKVNNENLNNSNNQSKKENANDSSALESKPINETITTQQTP
jgi:hypothetical protein